MAHAIILDQVSKEINNHLVISNLSLIINTDEATVLFGPSGCGKTTLLNLIVGLEKPTSGEIRLDHNIVSTSNYLHEPYKRNLSVVFQNPSLWPHMTVLQNITYGLKGYSKQEKKQIALEYMEKMEIETISHRYPGDISGGEARRVSIARALAKKSSYLLMDEPLVNIEKKLKERILKHILDYTKCYETPLLYITHDMDEAIQISSRIIDIKGDNIVHQKY